MLGEKNEMQSGEAWTLAKLKIFLVKEDSVLLSRLHLRVFRLEKALVMHTLEHQLGVIGLTFKIVKKC